MLICLLFCIYAAPVYTIFIITIIIIIIIISITIYLPCNICFATLSLTLPVGLVYSSLASNSTNGAYNKFRVKKNDVLFIL